MKVLVTGGAGFIGSHIVEHFQGRAEVRVLDNLRSGFKHNLDGLRCEFITGSILDRDCVRRAVRGVDFIFHLAAMISVPESMTKPIECNEINTNGTLVVLEEALAGERESFAGVRFCSFRQLAARLESNGDISILPGPGGGAGARNHNDNLNYE